MAESNIPRHLGFIIDGNRRWAKKHGLPPYEGHLAGFNALKEVALTVLEAGVPYMSAFIFSTENWKRSQDEVSKLMGLTSRVLKADLPLFQKHNVRLRVLGSREGIDAKILKEIDNAESDTRDNTSGTFAICFNYGGQLEIVDAVKKIVQSGAAPDEVTSKLITDNLYAPDIPSVDMIIRTSGEYRLSNFMLWRAAYSELLFLDKYWPDMKKSDVADVLAEYAKRHRRFGS
jgi:undecaprenyl diphosphate synthase